MIKTILCCTDFAPPALEAATVAAAMASRLGGKLILAHVDETPETSDAEISGYLRDSVEKRLRAEADRLRATGATVEEILLRGSVYGALTAWAEGAKPFAIVMASRTKSNAVERWLVGSTAERVVQGTPVPALIVRDASVWEDWLAGRRPLQVFVAADLSPSSDLPLSWAGELASIGPCQFTVGYVNWIPDESIRLGVKAPLSFAQNPPEIQPLLERDLREKVRLVLGDVPATILVEPRWGRADSPLIEMARLSRADLIVAGTRHQNSWRLFEESVSRGLLHHAPLNVAIVPAHAQLAAESPIPPVRRVLVPTDFSAIGNRAIPHAYALLARGGTVCLAHIAGEYGQDSRDVTARLEALIPAEAESRGIKTETALIQNRQTAEGICQLAAQFAADVICLGTHGRSSLTQTLLGSVTQAVAADSQRPVLLVPLP